jgi:hypothetical protein
MASPADFEIKMKLPSGSIRYCRFKWSWRKPSTRDRPWPEKQINSDTGQREDQSPSPELRQAFKAERLLGTGLPSPAYADRKD